jgi:molybdate transport system substrate-binding protein
MKLLLALAVTALAVLQAPGAWADEVTLIAPGGIRAPIQKMIPDFERKTGHTVKATSGSGGGTKQQVMSGEAFDVTIVQPPLSEVLATGHVIASTETPLAVAPVAVAVRKGAVKPDISTPEAVKQMLLAAKSVAYPDPARGAAAGASFDETLRKLGIVQAMQAKIVRAQGGAGAMELLAKGEVEIGLTFLSEIHDPGVEVVGVLPREISTPTALVGFVSSRAKAPEAAKALLRYLSSPEVADIYKALGMLPGR